MGQFVDLGTRNKGTFWEYLSAYSFLHTKLPVTKYAVPTFLGLGKGEPNKHCHDTKCIENTKKIILKEFKQGKYTKNFFTKLINTYKKPLQKIKKITTQPFLKDDKEELSKKVEGIAKALAETNKPMLLALKSQFIDDFFKKELGKVLTKEEKENKSKIIEITSLLLTPTKLTVAQKEEQALYELQKLFEKQSKIKNKKEFEKWCKKQNSIKALKKISKDCGWFHMEYMQESWTIKEYKQQLWKNIKNTVKNKTKKVKSPKQAIKEIKKRQEEFFKTHKNTKTIKELARVLRDFSFVLDSSKAVLIEGSYLARPLFTQVAKELDITWGDLLYLTPPEITSLLQSEQKADKELIKKRKQCRAVLLKNKKIAVYEGKEAKKLEKSIKQTKKGNQAQVKGIIAFPGKVTGKVTIIHSIKDKHKFKKGDVLVTHDGTAELTYFLKEASAIVTDQGGMICHAAIIAREMKTPCVVGTKVATKIFKDNDRVEVNAEKGTIKKVRK